MKNLKAYIISFFVFLALSTALVGLMLTTDLNAHADRYFLLALFGFIALLTVNVFQSFRVIESAAVMATGLAQDMFTTSRELFSELYRNSPVPYVLVDKEGLITSMNMAALRLFGATEGDLNGADLFSLLESDAEIRPSLFLEKMRTGLPVTGEEIRVRRPGNSSAWVLLSIFPYDGEHGARCGLLTLVDISKQKQIDQAKTEFVSLASHQLRTPIAAMKWNLELLLMKYGAALTPEERTYVDHAMAGITQMNLLLSDFLNVSRFELGTLKSERAALEFPALVSAIVTEHEGKIAEKNIKLAVSLGGIGQILSDERLLRMALNNLISNAVKYTPREGSVRIQAHRAGDVIEVVVADTGIGIPKDEQDRLFTKIFRASNAQVSEPDGTGLGLYIARQAIELMGGTITCSSEEGKGTTFTVTITK